MGGSVHFWLTKLKKTHGRHGRFYAGKTAILPPLQPPRSISQNSGKAAGLAVLPLVEAL